MKRIHIHLFFLCALGVALGGGGALFLHVVTPSKSDSQSTYSEYSFETPRNQHELGTQQVQPANGSNYFERLKELKNLSESKNAVELDATVYSFVAQIPGSVLGDAIDSTVSTNFNDSPYVRRKLLRALIEKLANTNPKRALDYALTHDLPNHLVFTPYSAWDSYLVQFAAPPSAPVQKSFVSTVFSIWATNNLAEASARVEQLDEQYRKRAFAGILDSQTARSLSGLRAIAERTGSEELALEAILADFNVEHLEDPQSAWEEISPLITSGNLFHEWVAKNVVLQWYERKGLSVVDEIRSASVSNRFKAAMLTLVLKQAVEDTPELAFRRALEIPVEERFRAQVVSDVIKSWAALDPEAAYKVLGEVDDSTLGDSLLRTVVNAWARNDPHFVLENMENFPPGLHSNATNNALITIARSAPREAAELALDVPSRRTRYFSLMYVLRIWMDQDLEQTIDWVVDGDTVDEQRFELVSILIDELAQEDPQRAFKIARNESLLSTDQGLEVNVFRALVRQDDFETALELLVEVPAGRTRVEASLTVGEQLIRIGKFEEVVRIGLDLPESEQNQYFPRLSYAWSDVAPNELMDTMARLPTAHIRTQVASTVLESHYRKNFTEAQLETLRQYLPKED